MATARTVLGPILLVSVVYMLVNWKHEAACTVDENIPNMDEMNIQKMVKKALQNMEEENEIKIVKEVEANAVVEKVLPNHVEENTSNLDAADTNKSDPDEIICKPFPQYGMTICIHDPSRDIYISKRLNDGKLWEEHDVNLMLGWLKGDPSLALIDIGANLGVYSLTAAAQGATVVSFEPFPPNIKRLKKSVELSGLNKKITIIEKGIADRRYNFSIEENDENQGRVALVDKDCGHFYMKAHNIICSEHTAEAITLDDIPNLTGVKGVITKALVKMDIEGLERQTIMASGSFWKEIDVPLIQMEWEWLTNVMADTPEENTKTEDVIRYFADLGYQPYNAIGDNLATSNWKSWPADVYFVKDDFPIV